MKPITLILCTSMLALSACDQKQVEQKRFETACVEELKDNLKAPASFVLVDAQHEKRDYVLGDDEIEKDRERLQYLAGLDDIEPSASNSSDTGVEAVLERFDLEEKIRTLNTPSPDQPTPVIFSASIDYDAQNGFGALLRGRATCEYNDWDGIFDEFELPMTLRLEIE